VAQAKPKATRLAGYGRARARQVPMGQEDEGWEGSGGASRPGDDESDGEANPIMNSDGSFER
jgi:hypothetical protein